MEIFFTVVFNTDVALTSDFIAGFCGETEKDHQDTLSLIEQVQYNFVFCFPYSMREVNFFLQPKSNTIIVFEVQ